MMWNYRIRPGTIWTVKSINEYDEIYKGMTCGTSYVYILSTFLENNIRKFTYIKISFTKPKEIYYEIQYKDNILYLKPQDIYTGDQRCLDHFITDIDNEDINDINNLIKNYFNLKSIYKERKKDHNMITDYEKHKDFKEIYKFGINVYAKNSKDVTITKSGRLILSDDARYDIMLHGKDEEEINNLSIKYNIYPAKAIKEIRYRLISKFKNK